MDFEKLATINLIGGAGGGDPRDGLCIMEMVSYFDGADRVTDRPACACRVLTEYAIQLNDDAPSQTDRDSLKLGTASGNSLAFDMPRTSPQSRHLPRRRLEQRVNIRYRERHVNALFSSLETSTSAVAGQLVDAL